MPGLCLGFYLLFGAADLGPGLAGWVRPEDRTLYGREFQVGYTRQGETFGAAAKKAECIVTGGLGTMPVVYKGVTYYVCCSGCRDAFNETPEKFVKEYNARKKGGK